MKILFFKENINYALDFLKSNTDDIAFWYTPGLLSYIYLKDIYNITSICVEEKLLLDFKHDYPEFDRLFEIGTFPSELSSTSDAKFCFLASNDTITKSYENILKQFTTSEYKLLCKPNENAKLASDELKLQADVIGLNIPTIESYSLLIMCNDWGLTERKINQDFLRRGKNTICLQESSIDFNDIDKRMRFCSIPIFQGVASLQNLDMSGRICAVIGNPRFETLKHSPLPSSNKALINVNFTYGMFEEARSKWVEDVLSACSSEDIDYVISQHPRDRGDFSGYKLLKSNPSLVHSSIKESSVVISRFSALLTEAVCLGRPAIYYNPHGEKIQYRFDADNKMFFYAINKDQLIGALKRVKELNLLGDNGDSEFLNKHLGVTSSGKASLFISKFLKDAVAFPPLKRPNLLEQLSVFLSIGKRILRRQNY